jgi:serine/threonine protein kinase
LQKIPAGPKTIEVKTDNVGWSINQVTQAPRRPEYVVYKIARVAFKDNGEPEPQYRRALQSVLTELHALIYPTLFHHANIIDFLGISWGSNPFSPAHKLPAIIVEYAQHGTLADFLRENPSEGYKTRHILALDVARGISALHQAGLVHGDVKAENVLVCAAQGRPCIAKIADFGFSIVEVTEGTEVWMGGTNPWRAPETSVPVPVKEAKQSDVYSLGLLLWVIVLGGKNPFDFIIANIAEDLARHEEVERLKTSDELLEVSKSKTWFENWLHTYLDAELQGLLTKVASIRKQSPEALCNEHPRIRNELFARLCDGFRKFPLVKSLDDIFDFSLTLDPAERDLDVIIQLLVSDVDVSENQTA